MIFLLGIYAVLMMVAFPGAIALRFFRLKDLALFIPLCFGLSLMINYFLVLTLTLLQVYTPWVLRSIGFLEGLAVVSLYYSNFRKKIDYVDGIKALALPGFIDKGTRVLFYLTWIALLWTGWEWMSSLGNVFGAWDPSVWYNRWAIEWSNNHLPTLTWHYPQLLSTNWSLTYVMMGPLPGGIHLEAFAAGIQGFFYFGLFYLLLCAFYRQKDRSFLLAIIIISVLMQCYYSIYLISGYADVPVAFFTFTAVMLFLLEEQRQEQSYRCLALIFALAAAYTKPAGIYTAIVIPLMQFFVDRSQKKFISLLQKYFFLFILIAPWYIYANFYETNGNGIDDILFLLSSAVEGGLERGLISLIYGIFPCIFLIFAYGFKNTLSLRLKTVLYCFTPYFFIWIFFFSYDPRNLILLWPLAGLWISYVICHEKIFKVLAHYIREHFPTQFPGWLLLTIISASLIVLSFSPFFHQANLIKMQTDEKNTVYFDPAVTTRLYAYTLCPGFQGRIVTDYSFFADLPMLAPYMLPLQNQDYGKNMEPLFFKNAFDLNDFIAVHPGVHYFLLNENYQKLFESPAFEAELQSWVKTGKVRLEFAVNQVKLYKILSSNS